MRWISLATLCFTSFLISLAYHPALAHGVTNERIHALDHEIEHQPRDPSLYVRRGRIHRDSENWHAAQHDYAKALQIDPNYHEAIYWQGDAYLQSGNYEQAKKRLSQYLKYEAHSAVGNRDLARALFALKDFESSAKYFDLSIEYDTNPAPQVYLERSRALHAMKPAPHSRIIDGLQSATEKHGPIVTLVEPLINIYVEMKDYDAALSWLTRLPKVLQEAPNWKIKKAEIFAQKGDKQAAIQQLESALKLIDELPPFKQQAPAIVASKQSVLTRIQSLR